MECHVYDPPDSLVAHATSTCMTLRGVRVMGDKMGQIHNTSFSKKGGTHFPKSATETKIKKCKHYLIRLFFLFSIVAFSSILL